MEDPVSWLLRSVLASVEELSSEVVIWILYGGYSFSCRCALGACDVHKKRVGSYVLYQRGVSAFPRMSYATCKVKKKSTRWFLHESRSV